MRILVTGAQGQLGKATVAFLEENHKVIAYGRESLDITDTILVNEVVRSVMPDWVLHCAAYTNVEAAEDKSNDLNWQVNVTGTANIAKAAKATGAKLIFISSDYVFDGKSSKNYEEIDSTNPINEYGRAKLAGEKEVQRLYPDAYIIRTSWVFGEFGNNFVYTMLNLSMKMDILKVVNDQWGRPTYTHDLAAFMAYIVEENGVPAGVYHFSNDNVCTWYEFATAILKDKDIVLEPCDSTVFVQKATRPKRAIMNLEKVKSTGFQIPTWQNALQRFLKNIENIH
ncbi:dTDP-4-dehydrorhamnose reductase [Peribacillus frigoritolerans]|uniref:dTDP-4-dehydrorhamnose reductase n=1 Tax=Peribacillus frigoritolerans TaxID=450367 RepID=UPI0021CFADAB|nr:dTDP-4-dehydrorhamnose reductase [Peribacillus frigoritolerans]MCU6600469.1 dTDP-4-dehydrorhamnose reductase [Peribacillus frigoritolerans]